MRQFSIAALLFFLSALSVTAQELTPKSPEGDFNSLALLVLKPPSGGLGVASDSPEITTTIPHDSIPDMIGETRDVCVQYPLTDRYSYPSLSPLLGQPDDANSIQLDIDFHMNSNAMPTTFAGAFLTGNTITPDMINRVLSYTKKDIKYEDELKAGLAYKHYFKKPSVTFYASYYNRDMRQLTTSHDAFQLIFEGNAPFENRTASLADISFQNLMYNQYSVGVSKSDGHFFAGINISYLQGYEDQSLRNPSGSLYTAPYGDYLNVAYDMTFNEATSGASKFFALNGQGVSADLQFGYSTEKSRFSFTIQDLGYISWHKHPVNYKVDTSFTFNGIDINNITNISGSGIQGLNLDSVLTALGPKKSNAA